MSYNTQRTADLFPLHQNRFLTGAITASVVCLVFVGCGSESNFKFDDYDLMPNQEEWLEFPLGHYAIPIPVSIEVDGNKTIRRNGMEFEFDLHVLVSPRHESQLNEQWERYEGTVRDKIIRICRNASMDDLQEKELSVLKSHIMDSVQTLLGPKYVRRLLITDVVSQEL